MGAFVSFLESAAGAVFILFMGLLIFASGAVMAAMLLPEDERLYVFLTGVAGNFSGGLFIYLQTRIRVRAGDGAPPGIAPPGNLQVGEVRK